MKKRCPDYGFIFGWLAVLFLLMGSVAHGQSVAGRPVEEYFFLIDTSTSMVENDLVAPLQVALFNFAATIPIDTNWPVRVRVFTFDKGLSSDSMYRDLRTAQDLEDAKLFLAKREYKGKTTHIFRSLDGLLDKIEKATADGEAHDIRIDLFTDGEDLGPRAFTFEGNVKRVNALRSKSVIALTLYYHGLGVRPDRAMSKLIELTEGIYFVDGLMMPPKAVFYASTEQTSDTMPVTFVNKTRGTAERWQWDFGDGAKSAEESPTHVFKEPGTHTVRLTASNKAGSSTMDRQIVVKGGPPKAKFVVNEPEKPKYVGQMVRFVDQSEGRVTMWSWDFGDGEGKSQDRNPQYVYKQAGTFEVVLTLTGPYGRDIVSQFVKVSFLPTVGFSFFPDPAKCNQAVKFSNESVGEYKTWQWDFGDGGQSQEQSPPHVFAKVGTYTVTLRTESVDGEERKAQREVTVVLGVAPPVAKFTLPVTAIEIGDEISPADQSTGGVENWHWSFGDGAVAEVRQVKHAFMKAGTYAIELTVSGPAGTNSYKVDIVVKEATLKFSVGTAEPRCKTPVVFVNDSVGKFRDCCWDFGDGTKVKSEERSVSHEFKAPKTYSVKLAAVGPDGKPWTTNQQIEVKTAAEYEEPKIAFGLAAGKSTGRVPLKVKIVNRCKGSIQSYLWDFGDGTTSDDKEPSHEYTNVNKYTITLTVVDQKDQRFKSTESQALRIRVLRRCLPPWCARTLAVLFPVVFWLAWRFSPVGLRLIKFDVDGIPGCFASLFRDKMFESREGAVRFKVSMRRSWLLQKRYFLDVLEGDVSAESVTGEAISHRDQLKAGTTVSVKGDTAMYFRSFNDQMWHSLIAWGLIAIASWGFWLWMRFLSE